MAFMILVNTNAPVPRKEHQEQMAESIIGNKGERKEGREKLWALWVFNRSGRHLGGSSVLVIIGERLCHLSPKGQHLTQQNLIHYRFQVALSVP